uniref:Anaphase-promoting complex subunit 10 n=1 Tax=Amazona collaria TaxID=241587 RepID=A0A8B9GIQ8_9PSIT
MMQLELVEPSGWIHVPLTDTHKKPIRTFMIQIAVLANHQNGRDTHMRQIKVYTPVEESSIVSFQYLLLVYKGVNNLHLHALPVVFTSCRNNLVTLFVHMEAHFDCCH